MAVGQTMKERERERERERRAEQQSVVKEEERRG
jgi:hypothetical protein